MTRAIESRLSRLEERQGPPRDAGKRTRIPKPLDVIQAMHIVDKDSGCSVPFTLWPAQRRLLKSMLANERLVVVKARQLGCSYLALGLLLVYAITEPEQLFLVARQSLEESAEAIVRLKSMLASLPDELRLESTIENVFSLGLSNGSRVRAMSSTKSIGRGLSARYVIADELAWWQDSEAMLAALEPGAHRLHVISTGAGSGDFFEKLYLKGVSGEGRWRSEFLSWKDHPHRGRAWYSANVTHAPSPSLARREHAGQPSDAFLSPQGTYFERFDPARNVADIGIVCEWPTYRGVDFGLTASAVVWVQQAPSGQLFVVHELLPHNVTTSELANLVRATDALLGVRPALSYCDIAGAARNTQTAATDFSIFAAAGLHPVGKPQSVRDGAMALLDAIASPTIPLVVSRKCEHLIAAFSTIKPDRNQPDRPDEASPHAHVIDATRYLVVGRPSQQSVWNSPISGGRPITAGLWGRQW
jgi:hypothetical protein